MRTDTYIPRRLDDAWKIGFWDVDVAAPVLLAFFLGYLSGTKVAFTVCMAVGIGVSRWVSRLKADVSGPVMPVKATKSRAKLGKAANRPSRATASSETKARGRRTSGWDGASVAVLMKTS